MPEEFGGQGLPLSLGLMKAEVIGTANWAWGMYPGLSIGAMNTLILHASKELKDKYLTKLASGQWSGTMCLTEPHCGTDLSQVKTRAEPLGDGRFKLNGTKIWISAGDHDLTGVLCVCVSVCVCAMCVCVCAVCNFVRCCN